MSETFLLAAAARAADTVATVGNDDSSLTLPPIDMVPANVHVEHKPGRGRYLTLKRAAAAGACLLAEAPVCWWVDVDRQDECCARCLKCDIPFGGHTGCTVCRTAVWCSEECRAEDAARHASVCPLLSAAAKHKDADGTSQLDSNTANLLHFCAHAVALRNDKPTDFEQLWWLSSVGVQLTDAEKQACVRVADRLKAAGVLSTPAEPMLAFVTELCKKDKASNFCLAMPPSERLEDEYGFECDCTRCVVERAEEEEGLDGDDEVALADTGEVDVTYISLFILKHVCGACLGTMAPLPPAGTICVCNRCGESRTEAQFLERVQEHMDGDDDDD